MLNTLLRTIRVPPSRAFLTASSRARMASTARAAPVVDSHFISQITAAEKRLTNQDDPVQGGPTARAQAHTGQPLTSQIIHELTMSERSITGKDGPVANGPTAVAQHLYTQFEKSNASAGSSQASGVLDSETISKITEKERQLTGSEDPVKGGPTARAQQHAGEPISSQALHDITEGEKKITGGERVKDGPTSQAQSDLAKSRS